MGNSRRNFLRTGAMAGSGILLPSLNSVGSPRMSYHPVPAEYEDDKLVKLSYELVKGWTDSLLFYQEKDATKQALHGGLVCPACSMVHGRCGDCIFPLLFMANATRDKKYTRAAIDLYNWMERNVSMPDGSWINEVHFMAWGGTTVFGSIALAESLIHFSHLLDMPTQQRWRQRLEKASDYMYREFTIDTGNINYPITCCYALTLIGRYLDKPAYIKRGKELAAQCLRYFTPKDHFIFGEGKPEKEVSPKGCYAVDLGYNVEESLPALAMYAQMTGDQKMLDAVIASMKTHLEFMLPDGGWDNSWGNRNFKWTYWGSRTSDGCQQGFALMAQHDPAFYKAAYMNTRLLQQCTHDHLLYGGPHARQHGAYPCFNFLYGHAKALALFIVYSKQENYQKRSPASLQLPRAQQYGVKAFADISTWLVSKGKWRATITGYDHEYSTRNGHATGGALSMLWHEDTGPLLTASMNEYQMVEPTNMHRDKDEYSICLTPRFEAVDGNVRYLNISDLSAVVKYKEQSDFIRFTATSKLVNEVQTAVPVGPADCEINYTFSDNGFILKADCSYNGPQALKFWLPLICSSEGQLVKLSDHQLEIRKKRGAVVRVESTTPFKIAPSHHGRVFNFVPGLEAVPVFLEGNNIEITISVH